MTNNISPPQPPAPPIAPSAAPKRPTETVFPFHRLARTAERYRWWRPLLVGVVGSVFYLLLSIVFLIPFGVAYALNPNGSSGFKKLLESGVPDMTDPIVFLFALGTIALMLPALWLATLLLGSRPVGLLSSVAGRIRWSWLARCIPLGLAVFIGIFAIELFAVDPLLRSALPAPSITASTVVLVILALLITPLQATAEEYVFRGYLGQTVGGWLKHPAWAILLPVPLFVIGHDYDLWGLADVAVFAIAAGYLTWRTGGLEAAIVAHVVNNTLLFLFGAFGLADLNAKGGSLEGILVTLITMTLYTLLVLRMAKRSSLTTTREKTPPAWASAPPPVVMVAQQAPPSAPLHPLA